MTTKLGQCRMYLDFVFEVGKEETLTVKFAETSGGMRCSVVDELELAGVDYDVPAGLMPTKDYAREAAAEYLRLRRLA